VLGVAGTWKDLTDNVNSMASNLTGQVRNIADVTIAVANGDLSKKITVDVRGEILQLKETINTMVEQLRSFASEVTRVARRSARKAASASRPSSPASPALGRTSRLRQHHGREPYRPGSQHRGSHHRVAARWTSAARSRWT